MLRCDWCGHEDTIDSLAPPSDDLGERWKRLGQLAPLDGDPLADELLCHLCAMEAVRTLQDARSVRARVQAGYPRVRRS